MSIHEALFLVHPRFPQALHEQALRDAELFAGRCRAADLSVTTNFPLVRLPIHWGELRPDCIIGEALREAYCSDADFYSLLFSRAEEAYLFVDGSDFRQREWTNLLRDCAFPYPIRLYLCIYNHPPM